MKNGPHRDNPPACEAQNHKFFPIKHVKKIIYIRVFSGYRNPARSPDSQILNPETGPKPGPGRPGLENPGPLPSPG